MNTKLSRVIGAVYDRPWYARLDRLSEMDVVIRRHVAGERLTPDEIRETLDAAAVRNGPRSGATAAGSVAVIPVYGMIFPRANLLTEYSGGATVEGIRRSFRQALGDEAVGSILFEFDSPGGYTDGIEELAAEIRAARGQKPIAALASYLMASAAYYLGSQADEVIASPSSSVGWIGTVCIHQEFSKADEMAGVTTSVIRNPAGKYQVNEYEALSDEGRAELQQAVDDASAQFHAAVAKGRGLSVAAVRSDYGQGGGMAAARAKAAGLVDRVDTYDETIRRLATGKVAFRDGTKAVGGNRSYEIVTPVMEEATPAIEQAAAALDEVIAADNETEARAAVALARARADTRR